MARKNVVGLFDTQSDAQGALRELQAAGFTGDDISFVANNSRGEYGNVDTTGTARSGTGTEAEEGAGFGATGGAVLGGLGGLLVGIGALAIPGIGPAVAAGTLATTLGSTALGAGIGAAAGGLTGALVGAGIPENDADVYAEGVRRGGAMIMVQADNDDEANRAADIMDRYNVVDIDDRGGSYRQGGWNRFDANAQPYTSSNDPNQTSGSYATTDYGSGSMNHQTGATGSYGTTDYDTTSGTGDADTGIGRDDYDRSSKIGTAGGAVAGAATGAAVGSAGGPVGTVIGGIAGAVTGGGVGAAGDAAGAEATDDDADRTGYSTSGTTTTAGGTAYGSATDYGTTNRTIDTTTTGTGDYNRTTLNNTSLEQAGEIKVPIVEEELRVGKREVESGGVRVNTRVEERPVNEQVTLREETVDVHRKPVDRPVSDADVNAFQEGTFEVRERAEEAIVDKQARVVEEIHVKKNVQDRTETVQDTVRRTDVQVEQVPGQTRTTGYTETTGTTGTTGTGHSTTDTTMGDVSSNEGTIERGASKLGNAVERGTGTDLDRDGDVGQRDTRNNY